MTPSPDTGDPRPTDSAGLRSALREFRAAGGTRDEAEWLAGLTGDVVADLRALVEACPPDRDWRTWTVAARAWNGIAVAARNAMGSAALAMWLDLEGA
jgi:hypothetical protein